MWPQKRVLPDEREFVPLHPAGLFCMPPIVSGGFRDDFLNRAPVRPPALAGCWVRGLLRSDAHRLGDLIFCQAFRLGGVLGASAVALQRPPIGRPDFLSGLSPRRGAGGVDRCAPTPTDWATRFSVRPSAPARCWERRPLRPDSRRLGDLIFCQAFRLGEVLGALAVAPRRPPIGQPDFSSGLPPWRGAGCVGRCAPTPTDWAT